MCPCGDTSKALTYKHVLPTAPSHNGVHFNQRFALQNFSNETTYHRQRLQTHSPTINSRQPRGWPILRPTNRQQRVVFIDTHRKSIVTDATQKSGQSKRGLFSTLSTTTAYQRIEAISLSIHVKLTDTYLCLFCCRCNPEIPLLAQAP